MRVSVLLLQLALCISTSSFQACGGIPKPSVAQAAKNVTMQTRPRNKNHTLILVITHNKQLNRRMKFPIIPPRLKLKSTTTPTTTKVTSAASTTGLAITTSRPMSITAKSTRNKNVNSTIGLLRQADIFEQSSSDNSPSIAWPVPRRPASNRRMWTAASSSQAISSSSEDDHQRRPVPKLLLPRPTRPAMYSLDGFVPKPSIIKISTTEAPPHIKVRYSHLVPQKTNKRKWYGRQSLDEEEEADPRYIKKSQASSRSKTVNRYTAFKRKGIPGKDYPIYASIPTTAFDCAAKPGPGMYADPEAGCQIWHMCPGNAPHRYSFMCPNGTIFNENRGVCDWWYNVSCVKIELVNLVAAPNTAYRRRYGRSPEEQEEND